jgi:small subunit ribosomal protein S9
MTTKEYIGTGRRKTAVSSVRMRPGTGKVKVNNRSFETYFPLAIQRDNILAPFKKVSDAKKYDMIIRIKGGGTEAQVIATRLGISRALISEDETRKVELSKARKRSQFSKR